MRQIVGKSLSGDIKEAVSPIEAGPSFLMMYSDAEHFEDNVQKLAKLFPGVPSIGLPGEFYNTGYSSSGVGVTAFYGVRAVTGVMRHASFAPVTDIASLKKNCAAIGAGVDDTVCIDVCTGNDACVLTTMYSVLKHYGIHETGGTVSPGSKVAADGVIHDDCAVYVLMRNLSGKAKVFKENLYRAVSDKRFVASRTDPSKYYIGELNGRPAKLVYEQQLGIGDSQVSDQTMKNPLGRIVGKDIYIVSINGTLGDGLTCYREVNDSDVLTLLELKDIRTIVKQTIENIHSEMDRISGIVSVNCVFRRSLFDEKNYLQEYLDLMNIAPHCGFFGYGEHYNGQFVNQTMSCVAFE